MAIGPTLLVSGSFLRNVGYSYRPRDLHFYHDPVSTISLAISLTESIRAPAECGNMGGVGDVRIERHTVVRIASTISGTDAEMASRRRCQYWKPGEGVEGWNTTSAHCRQAQTCAIRAAYLVSQLHAFAMDLRPNIKPVFFPPPSLRISDAIRVLSSQLKLPLLFSSVVFPSFSLSSSPAHAYIAQVPIRKSSQLYGRLETGGLDRIRFGAVPLLSVEQDVIA